MGLLMQRVVMITGAGSGLGRALALHCGVEGAQLVLCGRRQDKLDRVRKELETAGASAFTVRADVSEEADVARLVDAAVSRFGRIDVLINNAAIYEAGLLQETSLQSWNDQFAVNVTGPFLLTKACLPHMRKQQYGRIVNITSSLSLNGAGGYAAYGASKAALESLTRTTADEEGERNILANLFDPGPIKTGMHATGKDPRQVTEAIVKLAALKKKGINGQLIVTG